MHDSDSRAFSVTPYAVEGDVDYDRLLEQFGADRLTDEQLSNFPRPLHRLLRREVFYAGRDVDRFTSAVARDETVSIVTGRGPSGPMHLGHVYPFYFAKHLQSQTGAYVYIPLSDDEKRFSKGLAFDEIREYTKQNIRDILAVGFDPERTRIVVDTADADVVYPLAATFATDLTPATVEATYGTPPNVGLGFYPAVQTAHLLLPQLVHGAHSTLVPIAVDQDPHVRVCRDIAGKRRYGVEKPAALLSKFLPRLGGGGGKMSSSDDGPNILLSDDRETVREKVSKHAYSGGRNDVEDHRKHGGDPDVDVAYQLLFYFFEEDDDELERLAAEYRTGELLSGELKRYAADRIADFLDAHRRRRPDGPVSDAVEPYRLTDEERELVYPDVFERTDGGESG